MKPKVCFFISAGFLTTIMALILIVRLLFPQGLDFGPCLAREAFGLYCPGCGGTRAFNLLAQGKILASLKSSVVVVYVVGVVLLYFVRGLLSLVTRGKIAMQKFSPVFLFLLLGLTVGQCVFRNVLEQLWGIPTL